MKPSEFILLDEYTFSSNGVTFINGDVSQLLIDLDKKFIDSSDLTKINAGTCLGLEVFKIQEMIDFFRREDFNPYEWEKFKKDLKGRRLK